MGRGSVADELRRLSTLVEVYGHALTALEMDRSLSALGPVLADVLALPQQEAADLVKTAVSRGGPALARDLLDLTAVAAGSRDRATREAADRARRTLHVVARFHAAVGATTPPPDAATGPLDLVGREVQAFLASVTVLPASATVLPARKPPPELDPVPLSAPEEKTDGRTGDAALAIDPARGRHLANLATVLNETLQRWAEGEGPAPPPGAAARSPQTADEWRALWAEASAGGFARVVAEVSRLMQTDDAALEDTVGRTARRLVDTAAACVPRLLSRVDPQGGLPGVGPEWAGGRGLMADLQDYATELITLCPADSPLRIRFRQLATTIAGLMGRTEGFAAGGSPAEIVDKGEDGAIIAFGT